MLFFIWLKSSLNFALTWSKSSFSKTRQVQLYTSFLGELYRVTVQESEPGIWTVDLYSVVWGLSTMTGPRIFLNRLGKSWMTFSRVVLVLLEKTLCAKDVAAMASKAMVREAPFILITLSNIKTN